MSKSKSIGGSHKKPYHERAQEHRRGGSFHYHCCELLLIAFRARDSARKEAIGNKHALPPDALVAVILACAACEAFINELCVDIEATAASGWTVLPPAIISCAKAIREVENQNGTLPDKYFAAAKALGAPFRKGQNPFQDFRHLVNLRNGLMHLKPVSAIGPPQTVLKTISELEKRAIARSWTDLAHVPWVNMIESPEAASWACSTGRGIVVELLSRTPEYTPETIDPLYGFKNLFRVHAGFTA
jgi:hypothetical protein